MSDMNQFVPPYNFVPIDVAQCTRHAPVWHDTFPQKERLSGRIRCTAYALTPLIVGNIQHSFAELDKYDPAADAIQKLAKSASPDPDHKLLRPFRFPKGGYGIPASALKGMTASVYAAITHSPIERVNDRTFSFRPNMSFGNDRPKHMAGILLKDGDGWQVLTFNLERGAFTTRDQVTRETEAWLEDANARDITRWLAACPGQGEVVLPCGGGIDGEGLLEKSFQQAGGGRKDCTRQMIKVRVNTITGGEVLPLPDDVVRLYEQTLNHLKSDHLKAHPNAGNTDAIKQAIQRSRALEAGKIVFVEVLDGRIISLGMHFRYRWRYLDSITTVKAGLDGAGSALRPMFDVRGELGRTREDAELSPRRRLFGFVDPESSSGDGVLNALAGRVRFSFAEHIDGTGTTKEYVPLKILGTPKASSYEFYLTQGGGGDVLCDYGDTADPDRRGEPRGRKFYLHQPLAAWGNHIYRMPQLDRNSSQVERRSRHDDSDPGTCNKLNQTVETLLAPVVKDGEGAARFPEFRFTVLFENLDETELDALVLALGLGNAPEAVTAAVGEHGNHLKNLELYKAEAGRDALRAHKIGHGQPLGLGSLLTRIDRVEVLTVRDGQPAWADAPEWTTPRAATLPPALAALTAFVRVPGDVPVTYPALPDKKTGAPLIHGFHSMARTAQAEARRGKVDKKPRQYALPDAESVRDRPIRVQQGENKSGQRSGSGGGGRGPNRNRR